MSASASGEKILYLLKTKGAQTSKVLAANMQMTAMGVRQHLLQLQAQNLVESFNKAEKVGRPSQYWQLSEQAHTRFPDSHSQLTVTMLSAVKQVFGEDGLERLIVRREQDSLAEYLPAITECGSLNEKVAKLTQLRNLEGYMANFEEDKSGTFWLHENHCPICTAATSCQNFCRSELSLFQQCFADSAKVTRTEHLLEGARRCSYKIEPMQASW